MLLALGLVLLGVVLLWGGAEAVVKGAVKLALDLGMPALIVGLTVVAITTSLPEAFASAAAQIKGASGDIALGNIIGSNIANMSLVLGLGALLRPIPIPSVIKNQEMPIVVGSAGLLALMMFFGSIGRFDGVVLALGMLGYTIYQIKISRLEEPLAKEALEQEVVVSLSVWREVILVIVGVGLLIVGAHFLFHGAVSIARHYGMSDRVIGVTIVALGSSFPEIATVVVAAVKKRTELVLGNVLGSNIYNIVMVGAAAALIAPITFSQKMWTTDLPIMAGLTVVIWALLHFQKILGRFVGVVLIAGYVCYLLTL